MKLSFHRIITLKFRCDVYSGSIWERKYFRYGETVWTLFRIVQWNFNAGSQNKYSLLLCTESARDTVQVFASEWCPVCYACGKSMLVMWKWFERFLTRFSNNNLRLFRKYIFGKFFINKHQSTKHKRKTSMLQID